MKITAMLQMYNELEQGNLPRYMDSVSRYCNAVVVYDDGSTDGGIQYIIDEWSDKIEVAFHVADGNDFANEVSHKAKLLEMAKNIGTDWLFRIDADEVIEKSGEEGKIRELVEKASNKGTDSIAFRNANLWRSPAYYRLDNAFNDFVSCRLWRLSDSVKYNETSRGLHQRAVPDGLKKEEWADIITLHYGFASDESILRKYCTYKSHGQSGWDLYRLIDERTLRVAKSKQDWFRDKLPDAAFEDVFSVPVASKVNEYEQSF